MSYDQWKTRSPDDGQAQIAKCFRCNASLECLENEAEENEFGEFICDDCQQNAAEAAWERHCEAFHDGGSTSFKSLQQQQIEARRFK